MNRKGYTVLGWVVWQFTSRIVQKKIEQNRVKYRAAGIVVLVLIAGIAAAKSGDSDS